MKLLLLGQKAGPVLILMLLLAQDKLTIAVGVVYFAVLGFDLAKQIEGNMVCYLLPGRSGKCNIFGSNVELRFRSGDIRCLDVDVEVVALRFSRRRALSPCDCLS